MSGGGEFIRTQAGSPLQTLGRTAEFWRRASGIYLGYKGAQVRAAVLEARGLSSAEIDERLWTPHHAWAGDQMYSLAVDLRGFYLKVFQFFGARGDLVPAPICARLCRLHDQVPPMPASQVRSILQRELGVTKLQDVFEWIDLEQPLGSASLAQVHKAKLVQPGSLTCGMMCAIRGQTSAYTVRRGECVASVALKFGLTVAELEAYNPGLDTHGVLPGQVLSLPLKPQAAANNLRGFRSMLGACSAAPQAQSQSSGLVAVKVQYPDASQEMAMDLGNIRAFAGFLSKTELAFDLVSAIDELAAQIRKEFFFTREARVMDTISERLKGIRDRVLVPKSMPGLVTDRALVMEYLDGVQITKLASEMSGLSEGRRKLAARRILKRVSEAYGRMLLLDGLFQADGHPGNILVLPGGRVGLIDYGQSKQLEDCHRKAFAQLVLDLHRGNSQDISNSLATMGVDIGSHDVALKAKMAHDMFDTKGKLPNPFSPDAAMKQAPINTFPKDLFFVLRTTQLLRGLANGMGIEDFSCTSQWAPYARTALRQLQSIPAVRPVP